MRFPVLSSKAVSRQTTKQSAFSRIQVRASSQTKGLERGWTYGRVRLARFARLRLLSHASPISLLILRKKPTVLQSSFTLDLWQTTSASTTRQWEIQKQRFGRQYTVFFSRLFKHSKQGSSYRGWIYMERSEGKQKLLRVSGRFELKGVKLQ